MKRLVIPVAAAIVMLFSVGYTFSGKAAEEVRKLDSFDGIGISISADVFYTQGNSHEIRIEGDAKDVKDLITEVKDGFLKVKYNHWKIKHSKLTIYITSNNLEAVKISGSAHFIAEKSVNTEELDLGISGSGGVSFSQLTSEEVDVKISGSGNAEFSDGNAEELDVKISGSGKLLAEKFEASECRATISGSGSVRVTAKNELDAKMSGSGKVYYHGDPQVNSVSSGSGRLVEL